MLRRTAYAIPSLLGLLIVTFLMVRIVPADPAAALAGDNATPQQIAQIRHEYGFDRPLGVQLVRYLGRVLRFNFGESEYSHRPVAHDIRQRLPATLELTLSALLIATVFGIPLGVIAAIHHNRWPDFAIRLFSVTGVAIAAFWLAIMLQMLFAMQLHWLPLRGRLGTDIAAPPDVTGFLSDRQPARRPPRRVRGCAAPSDAAGGHAVVRRPGDDRPLHPGRRARNPAEGFRAVRARGGLSAPSADLDLCAAQFGHRGGNPDRAPVRRADRRRRRRRGDLRLAGRRRLHGAGDPRPPTTRSCWR